MSDAILTSVSLNVVPLPENDIWFASSAAWTSYWAQQGFTANVPIADINSYGVVKQSHTQSFSVVPTDVNNTGTFNDTDGNPQTVPLSTTTDSIIQSLNQVIASYENLKTAMFNAGLSTETDT